MIYGKSRKYLRVLVGPQFVNPGFNCWRQPHLADSTFSRKTFVAQLIGLQRRLIANGAEKGCSADLPYSQPQKDV